MADNDRTDTEDRRNSRITTDRDQIRRWADERDSVPASREGTEGDEEYRFFQRDAVDEGYRERDWDEFFDHFESQGQALVYTDEETDAGVGHHELIDRDEAAARATVEDQDAEQRLLDGETVTTEVTETTVVEREITETETIESEVVDTETIRSRITDAELVDWELLDTDADFEIAAAADVADRDARVTADEGRARYDDVDFDTRVDGDFAAEVAETWRVRREVDERATVESEVVGADIEERDNVEEDTVETTIDVEGVQRSIVEGGVLDARTGSGTGTETGAVGDAVDREVIETEQIDAGRMRSRLVQRRAYEDRIRRRKLLRFDFVDSELIDTETLDSELVESDIVEVDAREEEAVDATADAGTATGTGSAADADVGTVGDDRESGVAEHGDPTDDTGTIGEPNDVEAANEETRRSDTADETRRDLTGDDEGKTVVDETGEEIGVVTSVENETAYVDPHPGFFERIGAKLGWGGRKEDAQPLEADHVNAINRDRVVVDAQAESEIEDDDRDERR